MSSRPNALTTSERRPRTLEEWLFTPEALFRAGLLLIVCLYIRTLNFDFVYDDLTIQVSPWIQSWHGLADVFRNDIFGDTGAVGSSYYRPLASALIVLVARIAAPTPACYHVMALLIAVVVYALAYQCGRLLFNNDTIAALTALFFMLHPTKIETIAWIGSSACDGQAAVYFFGLLVCYLKWWESRRPWWLVSSVALFALAMFTKEVMVIVPVLIAVHAFVRAPEGKRLRSLLVVAPYLLSIAVYAIAREAVLKPLPKSSIAIQPTFTMTNLWSAPLAFWWYVQQLVLPIRLAVLHDWTPIPSPALSTFISPLLALALLCALLFIAWRRSRPWLVPFLSAWLLFTMAPAIALSPKLTVHDRYLQLAAFPFSALLAWGLLRLAKSGSAQRATAVTAGAVLVLAWSTLTWYNTGFWDNSVSLWQRAVQVAPHSVNARIELARLYSANNVPAAVGVLDGGLKLLPNSPGLWRMRGIVQFNAGKLDEARQSLFHSLEASKRFEKESAEPSDVKYGKATAAFLLGQIEMKKGNAIAADGWLRTALAIQPGNAEYESMMATNLRALGRDAEARQYEQPATSVRQ